MKLKASITYNNEPPLLDRMGLTGLTPVIEIDNLYWRYAPRKEISFEQIFELSQKNFLIVNMFTIYADIGNKSKKTD